MLAEKGEDVLFAVAKGPVHADECRLWERADERMQLRVVRVTFMTRGGVELVCGRAQECDLVDNVPILGEDLRVTFAKQIDRRVPRKEDYTCG